MIDEYKALLSQTKLFLLSEFEAKEWKVCDPEVFTYFKERAAPVKKALPIAAPKKVIPKPPPLPPKALEKPVEKKAPEPPKKVVLEPLPQVDSEDFADLRKIFQEKFPSQRLLQEPLSDTVAKSQEIDWLKVPEILILSINQKPHPFLQNLAKAISVEWGDAAVLPAGRIERENKWENYLTSDNLKLIIACDYGVYTFKHLMKHYKEEAKAARHYLGKKPLLLLSDPSLYLKEPKLKPLLWKALCDML